jgi:hypothetical protein
MPQRRRLWALELLVDACEIETADTS